MSASPIVQKKRDVRSLLNAPEFAAEIAKVLPKHLTPERMVRVALTATMKAPKLLDCTPESLTQALLTCSQAGLEPDGRLAHLIPYGDKVQVIFDYKGLVTLALRNSIDLVYADMVCKEDMFDARVENGQKLLTHRPDFTKPRGEAYAFYAVTRRGGETDWEVMTREEVDAIRKRSKASGAGPWVSDYNEMAKKTTLRRMSKRWDLLPEIRDAIYADDDTPGDIAPAVVMTRPLFGPTALPESEAPQPSAQSQSGSGSAKITVSERVSMLCQSDKITEGKLLAYLVAERKTDGSFDVVDSLPEAVLAWIVEKWDDIRKTIKQTRTDNES